MQTHKLVVIAAIGAAGAAAMPAQARDCSGYDTQTLISVEVTEVIKGHSLATFRNASTIVTDTATAGLYNLTMGECSGTALTTPDGKTRSAGHCVRKDKDGDTVSIEWAQAPGAAKGTWRSTGGTGKFADIGIGDQGWWQPAASDGGKLSVTRWGGTCVK